jgi:two-component system nitrate/nitrite response regulator NarL
MENVRHIRVLVADDHRLMRNAVRLAMARERDIEVVAEASNGVEVLPSVARSLPDIVLLDIRMPGVDGLEVLDRLHDNYPAVKVVMLSGIDDPDVAKDALRRGAAAFLEKRVDPAGLAACLRRTMAAEIPTPEPRRPERAGEVVSHSTLSGREREILGHVAMGSSNNEIARTLWLSEQTVKYHLTNVYRKLGVRGRTQAARYALEHGLARTVAESPKRPVGSVARPATP